MTQHSAAAQEHQSRFSWGVAPSHCHQLHQISSTRNLKTSSLFTWFVMAQKSSLKGLFVGKYRTVETRYLWYCGTTVVPWPRRYSYREKEVPRFHGSTVVPPNTSWKVKKRSYQSQLAYSWSLLRRAVTSQLGTQGRHVGVTPVCLNTADHQIAYF